MKNIKFTEALNSEVENVVENTKVSAAFVQELKEAFLFGANLFSQIPL